VGLILAALLFMKRMTDLYRIEETAEGGGGLHGFKHKDVSIYTIRGPLFFGAANKFDQALANTPGGNKKYKILRLHNVPVIDATGLLFLETTTKRQRRFGGAVYFVGVQPAVRRAIYETATGANLFSSIVRGKKASANADQSTSDAAESLAQLPSDSPFTQDQFAATSSVALERITLALAKTRGVSAEIVRAEFTAFDLSPLDAEERAIISVDDKDPLEDIFETVGVTRVASIGGEAVSGAVKLGSSVMKGTVAGARTTTRHTAKTLRTVQRSLAGATRAVSRATKRSEPATQPSQRKKAKRTRK
jgi:anti-anti-sigma regulatory factor